ncbi:MAG: undecaprenyl/decaprenyl-phosphate alpha-N-acetylglucosaminyl 1-phosphate transferase [Gammaproteobacteria bacterium]|nr:undecaprenyl/decaprenyl-phosphate alpha-N-acetylglucosaminyl 1-phosphate transferase [Gammaproteobacteria bacterium]
MSSAAAFGCLITVLVLAILQPLAGKLGLTDLPTHRKSHEGEVPLVGGLAIYVGFVTTCLLLGLHNDRQVAAFIYAGGLLLAVGAVDDRVELSPVARLAAQTSAALILCFSGTVVESFGELLIPGHELTLGALAIPFTVFATVALINAVNMSDGIDGLAGSQTLISLAGVTAVAAIAGGLHVLPPLLALGGAVVAFLAFNLRSRWRARAAVFLGDAGSNFLGLGLAWVLIRLSQNDSAYLLPAAALWFVSLQVFDTVEVVARRLMRKRSPFDADREHLHHVFLLAGFSVNETVLVMGLLATGSGLVGILAAVLQPPEGAVFFGFVLCGALFLGVMLRTWRTMRFLRWSICRRKNGRDRRRPPAAAWTKAERRSGVDRRGFPAATSGSPPRSPNYRAAAPSEGADTGAFLRRPRIGLMRRRR